MKVKFLNNNINDSGKHLNKAVALMLQNFDSHKEPDCTCFMISNSYYNIHQIKQMINDDIEFNDVPTFILAPISILDQDVFSFLPYSTSTDENGNIIIKKFSEIDAVIATSIDGTQIILRTNINGYDLNNPELIQLFNQENIEILGTNEVISAMNSPEFKTEEII